MLLTQGTRNSELHTSVLQAWYFLVLKNVQALKSLKAEVYINTSIKFKVTLFKSTDF